MTGLGKKISVQLTRQQLDQISTFRKSRYLSTISEAIRILIAEHPDIDGEVFA